MFNLLPSVSVRSEKPKEDKPKKLPVEKPQGRLLNQGQRKLAARLHDDITQSMAGLEGDIMEAEGDSCYKEELPPSSASCR